MGEATHDEVGRYGRVATVSEKERVSKKEVGETKKYTWNMPMGMYREVEFVASEEGVNFPRAILMLCRKGLKVWREKKKGKEDGKDTPITDEPV